MLSQKCFQTVVFSLGLIFAVYVLGAAISLTGQKPINKQVAPVGVPGVQVSIVNKSTPNADKSRPSLKPTSLVTAGADGEFDFGLLPAGTYLVAVNPPASTNPAAKSFFESRSNMRVEITVRDPKKTGGANPLIVDFVVKEGSLARAKGNHDMSKNSIQNIKAREAMAKENEITVEVAKGQSVSGRITSIVEKPQSK
jgi:hypothetical protein